MFSRNNLALKSQESMSAMQIDMILKEGRLTYPGYEAGGHYVCRILPGRNPEDLKTFDACRVGGPGDLSFGMWVIKVPFVRFAFEKKVSFCVQRDGDDLDYTGSPYFILRDTMARYAKSDSCHRYWYDIVDDRYKNNKLLIPTIKHYAIMPVITYHKADSDKKLTDIPVLDILCLSEKMFKGIQSYIENNWILAGEAGGLDLTDPNKGAFLTIWKKGGTSLPPRDVQPANVIHQPGLTGYDCVFTETFPQIPNSSYVGMPATLAQEQLMWYSKVSRPWSGIIKYMSYEEQADIISRYAPAGAVIYAFGDEHDSWISKECRIRANNERRVGDEVFSGYRAPQQQPQQSQYYAPQQQYPSTQYQPVINNSVSAFPTDALPLDSSYGNRNTVGASTIQSQIANASVTAMEADDKIPF